MECIYVSSQFIQQFAFILLSCNYIIDLLIFDLLLLNHDGKIRNRLYSDNTKKTSACVCSFFLETGLMIHTPSTVIDYFKSYKHLAIVGHTQLRA